MDPDGVAPLRSAVAFRPHHSHRRLRVGANAWLSSGLTVVVGLAATYAGLFGAWPRLLAVAAALMQRSGVASTPLTDTFFGISANVPIPALAPLPLNATLWIVGVCAALLVVGALLPRGKTPLRYWFSANVVVLLLASLFAFFTGTASYDSATFMLLVERTSILMILAIPVFFGMVCAFLPFSAIERIGMLALTLVLDAAFATLRIATFGLLTARFGAIVEANLYLFFGPLMDVVYFITIFSFAVVALGRRVSRISRNAEAWQWL